MEKRPLSLTIIGWLFIVVGCGSIAGGITRHVHETAASQPAHTTSQSHASADHPSFDAAHHAMDLAFVIGTAVVAIAGGVLALRGVRAGRWLIAGWLAFHAALSAVHEVDKLLVHGVMFAVIGWLLFRPAANAYFRQR